MGRKAFSEKFVKEQIESFGYQLLSKYKNSQSKLELMCDRGHNYSAIFNSFRKGHRCFKCKYEKVTKSEDDVRSEIESFNYKLLSNYVNSHSKISLMCDRGHSYSTVYRAFHSGDRCPSCYNENRTKSEDDVRSEIESFNYKLLSNYVNSYLKISLMCDRGHVYSVVYGNFRSGYRCPKCCNENRINNADDEARKLIESFGYKLLSKYKNSQAKLEILCDSGHKYSSSHNKFKGGRRCPYCAQYGFNPLKPAILYYLRFQHTQEYFYKIGITNRTVKERFSTEPTSYTIIHTKNYLQGSEAYAEEQRIIKQFKEYSYTGKPFLISGGNTELFTKDILELDVPEWLTVNL